MGGKVKAVKSPKLAARLIGPLMLAIGIFYLTFHTLSGERGIYALLKEERRLEALKLELAEVTQERAALEHRVNLMSNESLDRDLLDEESRRVLGVGEENELIIPREAAVKQ